MTTEPKFPKGTPEYEAYAEALRAELAKFVAGVHPYGADLLRASASMTGPNAPTFLVRIEGCDRVAWDLSGHRVPISAEFTYARYADAAAHFWGWVQLQPDDGWDAFAGIVRPAESNPYDLDRRGKDFTRGDQPWHVSLTVVSE